MKLRGRRADPPDEAGDILVVCTGNICRSPYVAALLANRHPRLVVRSAGTSAVVGSPPATPVQDLLERDAIPYDHTARALTVGMVRGARLVIAATAAHRAIALHLDPTAESRTFALLELARLLDGHQVSGGPGGSARSGDGVDALVSAAADRLARDAGDHDDDLADPWGLPESAYTAMAARVAAALGVIEPWLAG